MNFIERKRLEFMRLAYPKGTRIELIHMDDPYPVPIGTKGSIIAVDDIGTIHVAWDNGSTLGLVSEDEFRII